MFIFFTFFLNFCSFSLNFAFLCFHNLMFSFVIQDFLNSRGISICDTLPTLCIFLSSRFLVHSVSINGSSNKGKVDILLLSSSWMEFTIYSPTVNYIYTHKYLSTPNILNRSRILSRTVYS